MDREADDLVHHRLAGGVDGRGVVQSLDQRRQPRQPARGHQQRGRPHARAAAQQHSQHHLALGDEAVAAPGEVALAHLDVSGEARVGGVGDRDDVRHAPSHQTRPHEREPEFVPCNSGGLRYIYVSDISISVVYLLTNRS